MRGFHCIDDPSWTSRQSLRRSSHSSPPEKSRRNEIQKRATFLTNHRIPRASSALVRAGGVIRPVPAPVHGPAFFIPSRKPTSSSSTRGTSTPSRSIPRFIGRPARRRLKAGRNVPRMISNSPSRFGSGLRTIKRDGLPRSLMNLNPALRLWPRRKSLDVCCFSFPQALNTRRKR